MTAIIVHIIGTDGTNWGWDALPSSPRVGDRIYLVDRPLEVCNVIWRKAPVPKAQILADAGYRAGLVLWFAELNVVQG